MMPQVNYELMTFQALQDLGADLIQAHQQEIDGREGFQLQETPYKRMEELGCLIVVGVFAEGALVGYAVAYMTVDMHYGGEILAVSDALYVSPDHRYGMTGIRLMRAIEAEAKRKGAVRFNWRVKPESNAEYLLMTRAKLLETTYTVML